MTDDTTDAFDDAQDALDAARFDDESFDDVRSALADLPHLNPRSVIDPTADLPEAPGGATMPDWAWDRVSTALTAEASIRAAATHDNVVAFPTEGRGKHSRATRWGGGLVAASVTLIAVGVGYTALQSTGSTPSIVAGKARPAAAATVGASSQALAEQATTAEVGAAAAPPSADAAGAAPIAPTPTAFDVAESPLAQSTAPSSPLAQPRSTVVQAARIVRDTGTAYEHAQLPTQVAALLETVGVDQPSDLAAVPLSTALPEDDGFTETWATLRDCITWLTKEEDSQAIVVDRGTYGGDAAGVVVAPADPSAPASATSPAPTMSVDTQSGRLDVWVVTPDCQHAASSVEDYLPMQLQP
jgi:hypothetical protein